jgi:hypothetical protein
MHAAAARWRLGETAAAGEWMVAHGIKNPERWTAMLAP